MSLIQRHDRLWGEERTPTSHRPLNLLGLTSSPQPTNFRIPHMPRRATESNPLRQKQKRPVSSQTQAFLGNREKRLTF
jgi:hypothetical protein